MTGDPLVIRTSREIAAPPSEIFRHLTDAELVLRWASTLVSTSGYGEVVMGATADTVHRINGSEMKGVVRILDVHPPRFLVTEEVVRERPMTQRVEIVETPGGSRVDVEARYPAPGLVTRAFFGDALGGMMQFQAERSLDRLRAVIENPDRPLEPAERVPLPTRVKLVWLGIGSVIVFVILWLLR